MNNMITVVSRMNEPLPLESPSASSFKKPALKDDSNHKPEKKRSGSLDRLKQRLNKHRQKDEINPASSSPSGVAPPPADTAPKKKVAFARTAKVKKVRSRQHYTNEEQTDMWYTADEYTAIKKRAVQTLRLMMANPNFQDDVNHTSRGLESRTKEAAKKRKEFKAFSRELVLEEQENQREAGVHSAGRLRMAYEEASATALQHAWELAKRDERERFNETAEYATKLVNFEYGMSSINLENRKFY
jgi:hypothetical protein